MAPNPFPLRSKLLSFTSPRKTSTSNSTSLFLSRLILCRFAKPLKTLEWSDPIRLAPSSNCSRLASPWNTIGFKQSIWLPVKSMTLSFVSPLKSASFSSTILLLLEKKRSKCWGPLSVCSSSFASLFRLILSSFNRFKSSNKRGFSRDIWLLSSCRIFRRLRPWKRPMSQMKKYE